MQLAPRWSKQPSWVVLDFERRLRSGAAARFPKQYVVHGRNVIAYPSLLTGGGEVLVADAACPHRGADLGAGTVTGECVRCPYHVAGERECGVADELAGPCEVIGVQRVGHARAQQCVPVDRLVPRCEGPHRCHCYTCRGGEGEGGGSQLRRDPTQPSPLGPMAHLLW